jgi:hypothetical protein
VRSAKRSSASPTIRTRRDPPSCKASAAATTSRFDDYYILYHVDDEDGLTVLGVLQGPYHPLH